MINIGIIGCSEIAFRRFMPAVNELDNAHVVAVAEEFAPHKLDAFCDTYGVERELSFEALIKRADIDAIYVPQPPALHYKWAKLALENNKHVLIEKPSTTCYKDSADLVELAKTKKLALHENYMFIYHSQIDFIKKLVSDGELGEIRLIRANFGFPMRAQNDFRYVKALGGGALLDAGGYAVRLAADLLGDTVKVDAAKLNYMDNFEVDMYGNATLSNDEGIVCQIGFGMDCQYMCSLEVWGSKARLFTNRIFTAPAGYEPVITIESAQGTRTVTCEADSTFRKSIEGFIEEIECEEKRTKMYNAISLQAKLVEEVRLLGNE